MPGAPAPAYMQGPAAVNPMQQLQAQAQAQLAQMGVRHGAVQRRVLSGAGKESWNSETSGEASLDWKAHGFDALKFWYRILES